MDKMDEINVIVFLLQVISCIVRKQLVLSLAQDKASLRNSSLFAAGDVSSGGTSANQRQKFPNDDVKSVWNPVTNGFRSLCLINLHAKFVQGISKMDKIDEINVIVFLLQVISCIVRKQLVLSLAQDKASLRNSSLFAAGDVSSGGTSANQRRKFHNDDVKSVWSPVTNGFRSLCLIILHENVSCLFSVSVKRTKLN